MKTLLYTLIINVIFFLSVMAFARDFEARALLVPEHEAVLSSQISGQIVKMPFSEGSHFSKGQALIELDCQILRSELKKAQMDFEAAKQIHDANLRLQKFNSVSELEVAVSAARMKSAQANVQLARTKVGMCVVNAPFNGRVVTHQSKLYENIAPGDKLIEVIEEKTLKLHVIIPSNWLQWLKPEARFQVYIDETGKTYTANVTGFGAKVNPVNQTIKAHAVIQGDHAELLSGMSGTARFTAPLEITSPEGR
ncbi:MAG: efflux RND transporter periplasmic adaptor subunit [Proteobacteria bacterium]|nr:efflux RND transporter periplasmic adaptor subunit [Pseudomonadota bacterium]MBU1388368.1 efflux RND transporter periplasmic adaptor subunit [Pseudomonadota bacterium]MBU1542808.1 efflux RND transporter periplasmic adaptor subunit [Pseudomonadota bacterium]MBU2431655.1 efflux RND transporter periplasmic adaptor subunit [Pseudomonadota bacterium]MBU2481298.1 efflux RND transporter periplasmic adaptor subunit [Pseudomonadota bacterium]